MNRRILSVILQGWILLSLFNYIVSQFNIYEIEQTISTHHQYYHCLLYNAADRISQSEYISYGFQYQIIPYCIRPLNISYVSKNRSFISNESGAMTFDDLSRQGINSTQLLAWSASIDLAERYEIYLKNPTTFLSKEIFYKCSSPWFGPQCQYKFIYENYNSFNKIVEATFRSLESSIDRNDAQGQTCYIHLKCIRGPSSVCLDWREVCDDKVDCLNGGQDEENCFPLEINKCNKNEYRCHNGMQCIPLEFVHDFESNPDCIDRSDERNPDDLLQGNNMLCYHDPSFRCEEHSCQVELSLNFVCGDGQCSTENGRCHSGRGNLMVLSMMASKSNDGTNYCWFVMMCVTWRRCPDICLTVDTCEKLIRKYCNQSLFAFPEYPILFGHIRLIFSNNRSLIAVPELLDFESNWIVFLPEYICYDKELCNDILPITIILLGGYTCRPFEFKFDLIYQYKWANLIRWIKRIFYRCLTIHDKKNETDCRHSSLYQCANSSKCISKHRLGDGVQDCYENDDEIVKTVTNRTNSLINDNMIIDSLSFPLLCDAYIDKKIDGIGNETDETNCNWWPCNNIYTRCNRIWNCYNGVDESNCGYSSSCSPPLHPCISPENFNLTCLSSDRAGDGIVDCIGATDEQHICRRSDLIYRGPTFQCWNNSLCLEIDFSYLCDGNNNCPLHDDELVCDQNYLDVCLNQLIDQKSEILALLCQPSGSKSDQVFLSLRNSIIYPEQSLIEYLPSILLPTEPNTNIVDISIVSAKSLTLRQQAKNWQCNRGIHILVRLNSSIGIRRCLCPPAYYGDTCQYQSQRVSLTLKVNAEADWRTTFSLLITLIDHQKIIQSYDQIEYLAIRDCHSKFNFNLLYSSRPKNISQTYSVRIDAYDKHSMTYRTSWIFPIIFPFLPVYRISTLLTIPIKTPESCSLSCNHGECIRFSIKHDYTCRCEPGWSGPQCNIFHKCQCSPGSLCVVGGWPSICICPLNKFGPQCYLTRYTCHSYTCEHHGRCIVTDERISMKNFTCICDEGYSGETCQYIDTKITITFNEISIPTSILCHFITVNYNAPHTRMTIFKKISYDQDLVDIYASNKFHLLFTEFTSNYYLIVVQESSLLSVKINTIINPTQRCFHINELLNTTLLKYEYLRRIKLYHLACQQRSELKCLYDEVFMCLCNTERFANCFEFNHSMIYNCQGNSFCENGAQCFQDKPTCPTTLMCVCDECFYGTRCQLSTKGFALSLDAILDYKIRPHISFTRQSFAIKMSASLVIIIFVLGCLNSSLSILTFYSETSRNVGCSIYLFATSIISIFTMVVFLLKFFFLIYTQIVVDIRRSFLTFNCVSIDFLLQVLLSTGDWLNACVAAERAYTVCKGVTFDKNKSKYIAKRMVIVIILLTTFSTIHDPLHRHLIDDAEEKRTWCITSFSSSIKLYDSIILFFHFLVPLFINSMSVFIIIINTAKQRSTMQKKQSYKSHLRDQFNQKKYLLIPPCILVLLALPRLILSFLSGCMKSPRDPWRFLIGYLISFIPPILTFTVFILPSKTYKTQFLDSIKRFKLKFRS